MKSPELFDIRPDDDVIDEIKKGEGFGNKYRLFSKKPDFNGAIDYLNEKSSILFVDKKDKIKASIIIPVYGQLAYTLNCLDSLFSINSKYVFDIIVADDASNDDSSQYLTKLANINFINGSQNLGFIGNCNKAARTAKGEFFVFLNNDTRVLTNWLDELIESFDIFPNAGLVGSKIFFDDGSLQEAGGIVWQNGNAWNYGRNDDPNKSEYCFARQIDYVSGCSIAIKSEIWRDIGGFDKYFAPAYYEDTDIAFQIRERKYETWYQPLSKIIHYEGKTSGTDKSTGIKSYQVTNEAKFLEKWRNVLSSHAKDGVNPWFEKNRKFKKFVLIVDAVNITPNQDAGSAATLALIKSYQKLGYHVMFLPEDNFLYECIPVSELQRIGVECLYLPYNFPFTKIMKNYGNILNIIHLIRPKVAKSCLPLIKKYAPKAKVFYLNADLHYLRLQREAELANDAKKMKIALSEKTDELQIFADADVNFVHSMEEINIIKSEGITKPITLLPLIETNFGRVNPVQMRKNIIFLGGYRHPPNIDAALVLAKEIWPKVVDKLPDAKLVIAGANPNEQIKGLASSNIIVPGMVDDLTPLFEDSAIFVCPLRFGAGAKGKIVAAMARGLPIVATKLSIEGMGLESIEGIKYTDEIGDIANLILEIMNNASNWDNLSDSVINFAKSNFSDKNHLDALSDAIKKSSN